MDEVTTLEVRGPADLARVRDAAERATTPRLWLLAAGAIPSDGALPALGGDPESPTVSLPVDGAGEPADAWIGSFADGDIDALVAATRRRRVPLRFTPVYSLLVSRELVLGHGPADPARFGPYADIEWTARLFSARPGVLVPSSTVTVPPRAHPPALRALLRLGPQSGLRHTDRLRQLRLARAARRHDA